MFTGRVVMIALIYKKINHYTYRIFTMFSLFSFAKCFTSVSRMSLTFLIAIIWLFSFPEKTAPCAPLPTHSKSKNRKMNIWSDDKDDEDLKGQMPKLPDIISNGISQPPSVCFFSLLSSICDFPTDVRTNIWSLKNIFNDVFHKLILVVFYRPKIRS